MVDRNEVRLLQSFRKWLKAIIDKKTRLVIQARLTRLELGSFGDWKSVGSGVCEMRIDFGPGYRVYFGRQGRKIVILLCGGTKRTQTDDIGRAIDLWRRYSAERESDGRE